MRGCRRSVIPFGAFLLVCACTGGRETGSPATGGQTADTSAAAARDTVPPADTAGSPSSVSPAAGNTASDSAGARATPPAKPAAKPPAAKPSPKPAPAPKPAAATTPATPDTATTGAASAAETTQTATAPLRDQYHQAPRDTVTPEVYEGWKQYNLNCARCHGEDVLGTTIAPHLIVSVRSGGAVDTKEKFVQTVCAGRPEKGMPSWCALGMEMDKINAIYSYVNGRSDGKIAPGRPARRE